MTGYKASDDNKSCVPDCTSSQYYDSTAGECVESDVDNCGQLGFACAEHIPHWSSGSCYNNVCSVDNCLTGYKASDDKKSCMPDCTSSQYYDSTIGKCVNSNYDNCGQKGFKCSDIVGWEDGDCEDNRCIPLQCESNYRLDNGKCVPDINTCCGSNCINCTNSDQVCVSGTCRCQSSQTQCYGACLTTAYLASLYHVSPNCYCLSNYINDNDDWRDGCELYIDPE